MRVDRLVLETLAPVSKDRKCFRLINGVLVERTVEDVVPALQTNADGLKNVLEGLVKEYKRKQDEMETWKVSLAPLPPPPGRFPREQQPLERHSQGVGLALGACLFSVTVVMVNRHGHAIIDFPGLSPCLLGSMQGR